MISKIDTIQISTEVSNFKDIDVINKDSKPYIVKTHERSNKIFIALHISRTQGNYNYEAETYTYKYFKKQLEWIYKDLGLIDIEKVTLDRLDYCFDSESSFENMYSLNNILLLLYALEIKADLKNVIETNTILDQQQTSMTAYNKGKTKQLYIYNKTVESDNRHPYNTRQEVRQMRLTLKLNSESVERVIESNVEMLKRLEFNFNVMEQQKINYLYELYLKELSEQKIHSFTSFITRYQEQITTRKICEELYYLAGHKGKFKNWLKEYRKKVNLKFISKTEMKKSLTEMRKSIKSFMGCNNPSFCVKK